MSKFFGGKEITAIYYGKRIISATYKGLKAVWQSIKSCFGNGFWDNTQPWDNNDSWNN